MSDFSLTLVLRLKTSKIINGVANVQIKSEKVTPFGGIFHVRELFFRYMAPIIDKVLSPPIEYMTTNTLATERTVPSQHCQASGRSILSMMTVEP